MSAQAHHCRSYCSEDVEIMLHVHAIEGQDDLVWKLTDANAKQFFSLNTKALSHLRTKQNISSADASFLVLKQFSSVMSALKK